ncbi:MAG: SDR family NAD(P)-dependent oxidoreductase [Nostoc sp.]|uniref:SDR family NAD(P)-dependent oxidoreductase n=1 Tax=Nostoc sp. TaxID=1180 RepID=UPI002FF6CC26
MSIQLTDSLKIINCIFYSLEVPINATVEKFGGLDILVTNAGGPPADTFDDIDLATWETSIDLTLLSAVRLVKYALSHLRQSTAPAILTITSTSTKQPVQNLVLSNSIRLAVIGLTKTLSQELVAIKFASTVFYQAGHIQKG